MKGFLCGATQEMFLHKPIEDSRGGRWEESFGPQKFDRHWFGPIFLRAKNRFEAFFIKNLSLKKNSQWVGVSQEREQRFWAL